MTRVLPRLIELLTRDGGGEILEEIPSRKFARACGGYGTVAARCSPFTLEEPGSGKEGK